MKSFLNIFKPFFEKEKILINIVTRTSQRPIGFDKCHTSIQNQSYSRVKHIVSYDHKEDLKYLKKYKVFKVKVDKLQLISEDSSNYRNLPLYSPHNLYCNELLKKVEEGWVMFLDDDDMLAHNNVLKELSSKIRRANQDTLFIWQMQYPDGTVLPSNDLFKKKEIRINNIGSPCFIFHSKYSSMAKWDSGKCADFRFLEQLFNVIPNKVWIRKAYVKLNNFGDHGNKNDIVVS